MTGLGRGLLSKVWAGLRPCVQGGVHWLEPRTHGRTGKGLGINIPTPLSPPAQRLTYLALAKPSLRPGNPLWSLWCKRYRADGERQSMGLEGRRKIPSKERTSY